MKPRFVVAFVALTMSSTVSAQNVLGNLLRSMAQSSQHQQQQKRERQELLDRISESIRITPNAACSIAEADIRNWLEAEVNKDGLMDNIERTVFGVNGKARPLTALEQLGQESLEQSRRDFARAKAIQSARETGGEVPVGDQPVAQTKLFPVTMLNVEATSRIQGGLTCKADAVIDFLRVPLTYTFTLDPNQSDGWNASFFQKPVFTETAALDPNSDIRVHYGERDLTLAEARMRSSVDQADAVAKKLKQQQQAADQQAYRNSPAGQAATRRQRQAMVARQRDCEAHGGTWGYNDGQSVYRVDAATATGLFAQFQACYFLGK